MLHFFVAIAFGLQCQITQTHIHGASFRSAMVHLLGAVASTSSKTASQKGDRVPDKDDPAHCPLCQAIASSASAVVPDVAVRMPPVLPARYDIRPRNVYLLSFKPRHDWLSRGPPSDLTA